MNDLWNDNSIQFPRLIAELNAIGLSKSIIKKLADEMDLSDKEVLEIFTRATEEFDEIKSNLL